MYSLTRHLYDCVCGLLLSVHVCARVCMCVHVGEGHVGFSVLPQKQPDGRRLLRRSQVTYGVGSYTQAHAHTRARKYLNCKLRNFLRAHVHADVLGGLPLME